jgi:hypothetical protein
LLPRMLLLRLVYPSLRPIPDPEAREKSSVETSARKSRYTAKSAGNKAVRNPSKSKKQTICTGKRVYVERKTLKTMVDVASAGYKLIELNASEKFRFFGSVVGKHAKKNWKVQFYNFPAGENVFALHCDYIIVLAKGEEELPYTHNDKATDDIVEDCAKFNPQEWEENNADPDTSSQQLKEQANQAKESKNNYAELQRLPCS